ncbi:MAG: cadherin-like beta sandwich domain-containing protein [Lachnospiraceae bacterium]|nr:cadherin-like beta sandwich domain-containing protein [Lachnospiraceae bacterium]
MKVIKPMVALSIVVAVIWAFAPSERAHAASVSAAFEKVSPASDIRVEDMLKLRLSLNADTEIGAVEAYISYDSNVFEYIMGPDCILGGEGVLRISDSGTSTYSTKRDYLLYFQATAMGESKFSIRNNPEIYDAGDEEAMSVSSQPLTLTVYAGTTASSDATLSELKVGSAVLSPSFDPLIKDYNVHVENSVEKLAVSAVANDPLASVRVEGSDELKVGNNRITILVTAPDGTENKYVVYCIRDEVPAEESEPENEEPQEEKEEETAKEKKTEETTEHRQAFYITQKDDKIMLIADTGYIMMESDAGVKIPEGYYKTSILISGYTVTAFSPVPDGTPEYLLLILCKEGSEPGLYVYDRIEKTIQRYGLSGTDRAVEKTEENKKEDISSPDPEAYEKTVSTLTTVIAVLSGVCMLLLIIVIRLVFRRKDGTRGKETGEDKRKRAPQSRRRTGR